MKVAQSGLTLWDPWNSPDQNTEVDSLSLLQGIFPTQELNWGLLHCRQVFFYQLSYQGMGCKTGKGACSPPSSSLRRVPLSCSETPKTWITIWRQIFLTHAQRNMLYLENTYLSTWLFLCQTSDWTLYHKQGGTDKETNTLTWPSTKQHDLSSLLIAFLLLILIYLSVDCAIMPCF